MNTRAELDGVEFDWFGRDRAGRLAVFATAGEGYVPEVVVAAHGEHSEIAESFESSYWGSDEVWDDLAAVGLYVFDWSDGGYRRLRTPKGEISLELRQRLERLRVLPELKIDFHQSIEVTVSELADAT